jgi:hypothetical protein
MIETVMGDDWRLRGQERWLAGRKLRWAPWAAYRSGWDHDHCAFFFASFASPDSDHADFTVGFVTADHNRTWICQTCFLDFKGHRS